MHVTPSVLRRACALFVVAALLVPQLSAAAGDDIASYVREEAPTVTRGEFLQWSERALSINRTEQCTLTTPRLAKMMVGVVCAAKKHGALDAFGADLALGKPILRGEALEVLTALTGKTMEADVSAFRDVASASMKKAVANAIAGKWMNPSANDSFGVRQKLSGTETLSLLQAVTGKKPAQGRIPTIRVTPQSQPETISVPSSNGGLPMESLVRAVWELLRRDYLRSGAVDEKEAGYQLIEGLVKGVGDPYTTFMRPVEADNFQTLIKGELSGIGAHVESKDSEITIVAPLPKSPAEKAGLRAGDIIVKVDGISMTGISVDKAVQKIRGERGTTVTLVIRRGTGEFEIQLVRDMITIPEIEITWHGSTTVVIKIAQFGQFTNDNIRQVFTDAVKKGARGIVLDLRNNPGGLLNASTVLASNFLPEGTVVAQVKGKSATTQEATADAPTVPSDVKVAALVNGGTASASEIVAGALQDHKRAMIIGTKTFGKGTVQEILSFRTGEAIKITVAEWLTPKGRVIDGIGVEPDLIIDNEAQQLQRALSQVR